MGLAEPTGLPGAGDRAAGLRGGRPREHPDIGVDHLFTAPWGQEAESWDSSHFEHYYIQILTRFPFCSSVMPPSACPFPSMFSAENLAYTDNTFECILGFVLIEN